MPRDDDACTRFLQWALPRLGYRWAGFRKVRGTVCKRLSRRLRALGIDDLGAYRAFLEARPAEWAKLDALCRIPVSRFYRDRDVFDAIGRRILPELAAEASAEGRRHVRAWSAGCASGEEPYTMSLIAHHHPVGGNGTPPRLCILATDVDPAMLQRLRRACYPDGSLRDLPAVWRRAAFDRCGGLECLKAPYRRHVHACRSDIREEGPAGTFDLVLCRNLAFTYFDDAGQRRALSRLAGALRPNGWLVIGKHEALPEGHRLVVADGRCGLYRKP